MRLPASDGAEKEGFEPPDLLQSAVFKTAAIDHSATSLGKKSLQDQLLTRKKALSWVEKAFCREGGIRTPDTVAGITVFETVAFDHSATSLEAPRVIGECKSKKETEMKDPLREKIANFSLAP